MISCSDILRIYKTNKVKLYQYTNVSKNILETVGNKVSN